MLAKVNSTSGTTTSANSRNLRRGRTSWATPFVLHGDVRRTDSLANISLEPTAHNAAAARWTGETLIGGSWLATIRSFPRP